jgi:hypothetical protein
MSAAVGARPGFGCVTRSPSQGIEGNAEGAFQVGAVLNPRGGGRPIPPVSAWQAALSRTRRIIVLSPSHVERGELLGVSVRGAQWTRRGRPVTNGRTEAGRDVGADGAAKLAPRARSERASQTHQASLICALTEAACRLAFAGSCSYGPSPRGGMGPRIGRDPSCLSGPLIARKRPSASGLSQAGTGFRQ